MSERDANWPEREPAWEPIPLQLPLENPYSRQQHPSEAPGAGRREEPDSDTGRHVIVIDLA